MYDWPTVWCTVIADVFQWKLYVQQQCYVSASKIHHVWWYVAVQMLSYGLWCHHQRHGWRPVWRPIAVYDRRLLQMYQFLGPTMSVADEEWGTRVRTPCRRSDFFGWFQARNRHNPQSIIITHVPDAGYLGMGSIWVWVLFVLILCCKCPNNKTPSTWHETAWTRFIHTLIFLIDEK